MWELCRLADGRWSVRFEGEERWILPHPSYEDDQPLEFTPQGAMEIQRMLNQVGI